MNDIFDFGFTAVTEDELEAVRASQSSASDAEQMAGLAQDKLEKLYNSIQPLLNNLKANPEKDYIYWPNRLEKVEAFENFIQEIYKDG
tara:strand:- start:5217 stop:5480 length:264 start_codon:yes stop_codon:yes gene_type:complete